MCRKCMKDFEYPYNSQKIILESSYERVETERKAQGEGANEM